MGRFSRLETGSPDLAARPAGAAPPTARLQGLDPDTAMEQGEQALFAGQLREALRLFSRVIDSDSRRPDAWLRLVRVLLLKGDLSEAMAWIGRGLTVWPDEPALLALRAVAQARKGMVRPALTLIDGLLERSGERLEIQLARGEVLYLAGSRNAQYCFDQAVAMAPTHDWRTPALIGLVLMERRAWIKALGYLEEAAGRREREPRIWMQIGQCRARLGQSGRARQAYETAVEICGPDDPLLKKLRQLDAGSLWDRLRSLFKR